MHKLIIEGTIVKPSGNEYGQIEINQELGLIERVGASLGVADIKTKGLIFPGFIDLHIHAREDETGQQSHKEDFRSMSEAAIHGGVVHVCDMPNNLIAPVDDVRYRNKQRLAAQSLVDVTLYAGIGPTTKPLSFPVPYKVFMGPSVGDLYFRSQLQLEDILEQYRGQAISFHCEDPQILEKNEAKSTHETQRPREAEIVALEFALQMAKKFELRPKICHLSTQEGIDSIIKARKKGIAVTAEVTPHHLYFDSTMMNEGNLKWLQVNPPMREPEDRIRLIAALKDGILDFLASDHAPHTGEEKLRGVSGIPHLDTYGLFVTWLMKEHDFTAQDILRVCAKNPAEFVNEFLPEGNGKGFGEIAEGYIASLTIIDPDMPTLVEINKLKTKSRWTAFEGVTFPGRVLYTIIRGKVYESSL